MQPPKNKIEIKGGYGNVYIGFTYEGGVWIKRKKTKI